MALAIGTTSPSSSVGYDGLLECQTLADVTRWPDAGLVREGLRLLKELPRTATMEVLLATDLHAGNVLRSEREPWLVIDPKPFVGDPAYDATQHLFNCDAETARRTRTGRSAALRTCLAWIASAFDCGRLPAPRRSRATIGGTTIQ